MANIEALTQLRRVVLEAPDDGFNMEWYGKKTECGTVCCAAGWAALDPWFLANTIIGDVLPVDRHPDPFRRDDDDEIFDLDRVFPEDGREPISGLARIFDISKENSSMLFNGPTVGGVTKEDVIANIDRLVRGEPARRYADPDGDVY